MSESTDIPPTRCPYCSYKMDASTGVFDGKGHSPQPGDYSLCLNCGKVAIFTEGMGIRLPTEKEALEINTDMRIMNAQITRAGVVTKDLRNR